MYICRFSERLSALLMSAMWLFEKCTLVWISYTEHYVGSIVAAASLVLTVLQHLQHDRRQTFTKTFSRMSSCIQTWIKHNQVIGGSMFGKELSRGYYRSNVVLYGSEEIKVCFP